jgi:hypothetical protein
MPATDFEFEVVAGVEVVGQVLVVAGLAVGVFDSVEHRFGAGKTKSTWRKLFKPEML